MLGRHDHPEISMHAPSLAQYVKCLNDGNLAGVGELMLASARKLASIGADFLICPDNTIHQAFAGVESRSPLPWLHIADMAVVEAAAKGFRSVGILGTKWLVDSDVYPDRLAARGIEYKRPSNADRDEIDRIIMDELVHGRFELASLKYCKATIGRLRDEGCDAVVLACTELPLILNDRVAVLPTLDSTRLLARAALRRALQMREGQSQVFAEKNGKISQVTLSD